MLFQCRRGKGRSESLERRRTRDGTVMSAAELTLPERGHKEGHDSHMSRYIISLTCVWVWVWGAVVAKPACQYMHIDKRTDSAECGLFCGFMFTQ